MKLIISILLTAALSFLGGLWFDWWIIAVAALVVALVIPQSPGRAFLAGFLGAFLLWAIYAWWRDMKNEHILSQKIASVLPLGGSSLLLILVTGLVAGLVAGFAALTGSYARPGKITRR